MGTDGTTYSIVTLRIRINIDEGIGIIKSHLLKVFHHPPSKVLPAHVCIAPHGNHLNNVPLQCHDAYFQVSATQAEYEDIPLRGRHICTQSVRVRS